ncbi:hypothetical protein D7D82_05485 [Escherichia coli]|nr:hypothetical protein [Escherichia coli]EGX02175.1 hypothetical protein ECSTECMHI813_3868 [Escherichia coli STEC_MHI813]EFE7999893.1 hypothetical protein [Escherichia coli]EFN8793895.1 hypothetical protein [Escherichia coli]EFO3284352.1 hypothetical protein [Escherichia coli]
MDNKTIAFARDNAQLSSLLMGHIVLPDKEGVLLRNCRVIRQFHGIQTPVNSPGEYYRSEF